MQSRDEIAEQVVALAGSVSNEKAQEMRELVRNARMQTWLGSLDASPQEIVARVADLEREAGMNLHESKLLTARIDALESSMSKVRERTYEIVREEMALVRSGEDPHAAPSPDPIPAWMLSAEEIADLAPVEHPTGTAAWWRYFSVALRTSIARRAPKLPTPEEVAAPIRAALEASRSPSHELVEAADAMRGRLERVMRMEYGDAADLTKEIVAYDAARSRHASGAQPSGAPAPASAHVDREKAKLADEYAAVLKELRDEDGDLYGWSDTHSGESIVGMVMQDAKDWLAQYEALELPASAQEAKTDPARCPICNWTFARSRKEGCVPGDCSYRPAEGSDEWYRILARREALNTQPSGAPAPASAQRDAETTTRIYTSGYRSGHHDTVEGQYTDVHPSEEGTYLSEDAVAAFAALPASAHGDVCKCGHVASIHDDRHGDGTHGGSCLEIVGKRVDGSDDFCQCSEFNHAQ